MERAWETDNVGTRSTNNSGLSGLDILNYRHHMPNLTELFEKCGMGAGNAPPPLILEDFAAGKLTDRRPQRGTTADHLHLANLEVKMDGAGTQSPAEKLAGARKSLLSEAPRHGLEAGRLGVFMNDFEQRCKQSEERGLKSPSSQQIAKTYETLNEMLKGPAQNGGLADKDRADLVKTTLYNLSNPLHIDQSYNLCNVTTAEVYTAARYPENYARLIKEVALTGGFTTTSGRQITLPSGSIDRGAEQVQYTTENVGGNRWTNWASKIFQETGINSVVPFLEPNANYPAWGKPHTGGKSDMTMTQILAACQEINGTKMPYFGVGDAPNAAELLKLKEEGDFPAGVHTIHTQDANGIVSGLHVQTIQDVRVRNGELEVFLDNQRGAANDQGWVSLHQLHVIQNYPNLSAQWYEIPQQYAGRDFDSLAPARDTSTREQQNPLVPNTNQAELPAQPNKPADGSAEQKRERTETPGQDENSLASRRQKLEQALFAGMTGPLKDKHEAKVREILDSVEKRCADDRASGLVAPGEAQIAQAYQSACRTLTNRGVMPDQDRQKMVIEGLRNISDPRGIDQGDHGTCGNTSGEKFIAVRNPEIYMQALEQVAASGSYTAKDGRTIQLPYDDVHQCNFGGRLMTWQRGWKPDSESRTWDVNKEQGWHPLNSTETRRNYASQIMQNLNLADALESARLGQRQLPSEQGADGLCFLHVEDFTKRMTGKPITTINQGIPSEGNIMQPMSDDLALQLKRDGRYPAMVWRAYHWQTIHDARTVVGRDAWGRSANVVQVLSDNQWGNYRDRGWETLPQLQQELSESP